MRLKFYKRSAEKFVSRIDPEAFSASGSRFIFPVDCRLRFKASATKRDELEEIPKQIPRCLSLTLKSFSGEARRGVSFQPEEKYPSNYCEQTADIY